MNLVRLLASAFLLLPFAGAQTPVKPPNATGQCRDGSYSTAASKSGACRGHHGVKDWYAPVAFPSAPSDPAPLAQAPVPPAPAPAAAATPKPAAAKGPKANLANIPVAPGGGPGLVWVNTASNVYHCPGTDFYGKTKAGAYMSEADAKAKGAHPNRNHPCAP